MDDLPPPPYSAHDPHTPLTPLTPVTSSSEGSQELGVTSSPIRTSLRGGYMRIEPEDVRFPSATTYFEERAFHYPAPPTTVVVDHLIITPATCRDDLVLPGRMEEWETRDVFAHDWSTFVNYVLSELGSDIGAEAKEKEKPVMSVENFQERQRKIQSVVTEWNEGFFWPRRIRIAPRFSYDTSVRRTAPTPTYWTVESESAQHPRVVGPPLSPNQTSPVPPFSSPPSFLSGGPMPSREPGPSGQPMHPVAGPPFVGHAHPPGFSIPPHNLPFRHESRGRGRFRWNDHHGPDDRHAHFGHHDHHRRFERGGFGFRGFRDGPRADWGRHGIRMEAHGDGERRGHHGRGKGRRSRSSSTSSSSSSSSDSSISSLSSEELNRADLNEIRQKLADFRLDPTKKQHIHTAVRQLRADIRSDVRAHRTQGNREHSREWKSELRSQKRAIRSEVRALMKEAKAFKRDEKRKRKAEKKQRKAERRARKSCGRERDAGPSTARGMSEWQDIDEPTTEGQTHGVISETELQAEGGHMYQRERAHRGDEASEVQHRHRTAKEMEKQARRLEKEAEQRRKEAEALTRQYEKEAEQRRKEAEALTRQYEKEAEQRRKEAEALARRHEKETEQRQTSYARQADQMREQRTRERPDTTGAWPIPESNPRDGIPSGNSTARSGGGQRNGGYATSIANVGETVGQWGERIGRDMEVWGERLGRNMEHWGERLDKDLGRKFS